MATQTRDLPDVTATKVDEKGRDTIHNGKSIVKKFPGQQWKLMGSDPASNGGWKPKAAETPAEIVETGNLTGATLNDGAGSGVDGKKQKSSKGKTGKAVDKTQVDTTDTTTDTADNDDTTNDDDELMDVTNQLV